MESRVGKSKELPDNLEIRAKKSLGQHFLTDRSLLKHIAKAAELEPNDTVIEVGPGLGVLTEALVKRVGHVIAVEIDRALAQALPGSSKLTVINADILSKVPEQLLGDRVSSYKVVANLPYNIASQVLRRFLEASLKPSLMVVMVQHEVARNMVSQPPDMNLLAVAVQLYGRPRIVRRVPPGAFRPRPKVDSAIVLIDVYEKPVVDVDVEAFFRVARAGFGSKRKQLRNALAHGLDMSPIKVEQLLLGVGIDYKRRAQTVTLDEWAEVSRLAGGKR